MGHPSASLGLLAPDECELGRPVLHDPGLQAEFDRSGYVVVDLLEPSEVERLYREYVESADAPEGVNPPGAYNATYAEFSYVHSRPDFRRRAHAAISEVLLPRAEALLVDYRPLLANYVNKPPGGGLVPAHQNLSVVDEARFQSVSVWVALVDCVVDNGALWLGSGSHRVLRGRRGMWSYAAFSEVEEEVVEDLLTPVAVRAGQAVVLDDALVHYSPPNRTDRRRLAIQFVMVPDEADALYFQHVGTGDGGALEVDVWRVREPFFFEFWDGAGDPRYGEVVDHIDVPDARFDVTTLRSLLPSH